MSDPEAFLRASLVPATRVERYNREWRMGQLSEDGRLITGRIGFQRAGGATELWDDKREDFVVQRLQEGSTSPFAVDLRTFDVAFQLRPGFIKRTSFTGAFQDLLNEAAGYDAWEVVPLMNEMTFEDWRAQVDRITSLRIRVERPNPHYGPRERVEELIEGTRSRVVTLALQAAEDDPGGIDVTEPLVAEAIDHAALDYGYFKAEGIVNDRRVEFDSKRDAAPPERRVAVDPTTREAAPEVLRRAVREVHREE